MRARPEFSFDQPFIVSVTGGLVYDGTRYPNGASFEWRKLGLSELDVWHLWVQFQIDNTAAVADPIPKAPPPPPPPAKPNSHRQQRR